MKKISRDQRRRKERLLENKDSDSDGHSDEESVAQKGRSKIAAVAKSAEPEPVAAGSDDDGVEDEKEEEEEDNSDGIESEGVQAGRRRPIAKDRQQSKGRKGYDSRRDWNQRNAQSMGKGMSSPSNQGKRVASERPIHRQGGRRADQQERRKRTTF